MINLKTCQVTLLFNPANPYVIYAGKVIIQDGVVLCKDVWLESGVRLPDMVAAMSNAAIKQEEPAWWENRHGDDSDFGNRR